ncbi:LysR substrate-binding domain-containing protein [Sneathiella sp.]|uniref:LysR substrate-binding domain-containing protein n=1 Tax=Sneathiella sp. TaxID=1964365 RepID=UPI003565490A
MSLNHLQLGHLRTLIAIADTGGFTAAGEHLGRTQSTITQQMNSLQEIIGVPIFYKKGRKREFTEEGIALLQNSREIIARCNHAIAAAGRSTKKNFVKLGFPPEVADDLLPPILEAYAQKWPQVRVIVQVVRSPILMDMLEDGTLDIIISTRRSDAFHSMFILKSPVHWIAGPDWHLDPASPIPLILTDEPSMFRRIALSALDLAGLPYYERFTSPSLAGVSLAVAANIGVTARIKSHVFDTAKIVTERDGLPPLPDVQYFLHREEEAAAPHILDLYSIILETSRIMDLS